MTGVWNARYSQLTFIKRCFFFFFFHSDHNYLKNVFAKSRDSCSETKKRQRIRINFIVAGSSKPSGCWIHFYVEDFIWLTGVASDDRNMEYLKLLWLLCFCAFLSPLKSYYHLANQFYFVLIVTWLQSLCDIDNLALIFFMLYF